MTLESNIKAMKEESKNSISKMQSTIKELNSKIQKHDEDNKVLSINNKELKTKLSTSEDDYNNVLSKYKENDENYSNLLLQNQKLLIDIDMYKTQIKKASAYTEESKKSISHLQTSIESKDKIISQLNAQLKDYTQISNDANSIRQTNSLLTEENKQLLKHNQSLQEIIHEITSKLADIQLQFNKRLEEHNSQNASFKEELGKLKVDIIKAKESKDLLQNENQSLKKQLLAKPSGKAIMYDKCSITLEYNKEEPMMKKKKPKQMEDELNTLRKEQKKYVQQLNGAIEQNKRKDRTIRVTVTTSIMIIGLLMIGVSYWLNHYLQ